MLAAFMTNASQMVDNKPSNYQIVMSSNQCVCAGEISEQHYSTIYSGYNFLVIIILLPLVALFGVFSNVVNIVIFSRPRMMASSSIYLIALAGSDMLVISTGLFTFCLDSVREYLPNITDFVTTAILVVLPIGYMAQTGSVYFTVGAAIDCYINVCWEPFKHCYCTVKKAKSFVHVVLIFTVCYNTLRFWQFYLHDCFVNNEPTVEICTTSVYDQVNIVYNVYMYMVLMTFLPFILLSILNALIVHNMKQKNLLKAHTAAMNAHIENGQALLQQFSHSALIQSPRPSEEGGGGGGGGGGDDDTVITMVMVVILFLACNVLALVINVVETFFEPDRLLLNYLTDTSNFLVVFNSSVNFVVYILFDSQYRNVLLSYMPRSSYHQRHQSSSHQSPNADFQALPFKEFQETEV